MMNDVNAKLLKEIKEFTAAAHAVENHYIEIMGAAYLLHTKLPPDRVQLVRKMDGDKVVFYYEERNNGETNPGNH